LLDKAVAKIECEEADYEAEKEGLRQKLVEGRAQIDRGDFVTGDELEARLILRDKQRAERLGQSMRFVIQSPPSVQVPRNRGVNLSSAQFAALARMCSQLCMGLAISRRAGWMTLSRNG